MLRKLRKSHILFFICVFGLVSLCLTNGFADDEAAIEAAILEGRFEAPTAEGAGYIQGNGEIQRGPDRIIGTNDFEKMRDLPPNSQDYILGRKVGWFVVPNRDDPGRVWICTGFLVGPDLFMTNHHCIHDEAGLLPLENAAIFMDYYQESDVDPKRGGITARVAEILQMDELLDYALLRLDQPIGNTYGWLELDTTTPVDSSQSVKLISHPEGRSKEIVRNNTEIVDLPPAFTAEFPFILAYLADSKGGSSGSPVFLREGTGVIGIHHSAYWNRLTGEPLFNAGSLMSYIVPEIEQYLPVPSESGSDLVVETAWVSKSDLIAGESFTLSAIVKNKGGVAAPATTLWFYESFDSNITPFDIEVGSVSVDSLAPSATSEVSLTLTAPPPDMYYYGACVDVVNNETLIDNNCSTGVSVTVGPSSTVPLSFNPSTFADQTFPVDTLITPLQLPAATGGTAPYSYTLSPIPSGLDFDGATQLLTGTPTTVSITNVTYTATDATGASASLTFTITVSAPLDVNGDGQVDVLDLILVAVFYGTSGNELPADVNGDGIVNVQDFAAVAAGVDAANALPLEAIEAALLAAAEQAAALEAGAAAPVAFGNPPRAVRFVNTAYRNVADALADTRRLAATDAQLDKSIALLQTLLSLLAEMRAIPEATALHPNYPNPFNPETWIPYHLAKDAAVVLTIHDIHGRVVRVLDFGHQPAGIYQSRGRAAYWDGKNQFGEKVASGVYFYTLTAGDFTATRKLLIAK